MTPVKRLTMGRTRFSVTGALTIFVIGLSLVFPGICPARAQEEPVFVQGTWAVVIDRSRRGCVWQGRIRLVQRGSQIVGSGWANAKGRSTRCRELRGKVEGTVSGPLVRFGFATGPLGTARFEGYVDSDRGTIKGDWASGSRSGNWSAKRER
ncbi:MAG: hypothetical protein OEO83_05610 [Alphaproteobacteria bacterium]|nr:hypothetical protein [Alphaproteobacteria bacterium]